jgi:hypothetical protein
MPAGVRLTRQNGKSTLIGQLIYFSVPGELCSVCSDMKHAVETRSWFIEAHREYLNQIKVKKQLMGGV